MGDLSQILVKEEPLAEAEAVGLDAEVEEVAEARVGEGGERGAEVKREAEAEGGRPETGNLGGGAGAAGPGEEEAGEAEGHPIPQQPNIHILNNWCLGKACTTLDRLQAFIEAQNEEISGRYLRLASHLLRKDDFASMPRVYIRALCFAPVEEQLNWSALLAAAGFPPNTYVQTQPNGTVTNAWNWPVVVHFLYSHEVIQAMPAATFAFLVHGRVPGGGLVVRPRRQLLQPPTEPGFPADAYALEPWLCEELIQGFSFHGRGDFAKELIKEARLSLKLKVSLRLSLLHSREETEAAIHLLVNSPNTIRPFGLHMSRGDLRHYLRDWDFAPPEEEWSGDNIDLEAYGRALSKRMETIFGNPIPSLIPRIHRIRHPKCIDCGYVRSPTDTDSLECPLCLN